MADGDTSKNHNQKIPSLAEMQADQAKRPDADTTQLDAEVARLDTEMAEFEDAFKELDAELEALQRAELAKELESLSKNLDELYNNSHITAEEIDKLAADSGIPIAKIKKINSTLKNLISSVNISDIKSKNITEKIKKLTEDLKLLIAKLAISSTKDNDISTNSTPTNNAIDQQPAPADHAPLEPSSETVDQHYGQIPTQPSTTTPPKLDEPIAAAPNYGEIPGQMERKLPEVPTIEQPPTQYGQMPAQPSTTTPPKLDETVVAEPNYGQIPGQTERKPPEVPTTEQTPTQYGQIPVQPPTTTPPKLDETVVAEPNYGQIPGAMERKLPDVPTTEQPLAKDEASVGHYVGQQTPNKPSSSAVDRLATKREEELKASEEQIKF